MSNGQKYARAPPVNRYLLHKAPAFNCKEDIRRHTKPPRLAAGLLIFGAGLSDRRGKRGHGEVSDGRTLASTRRVRNVFSLRTRLHEGWQC